MAHWVLRGRQAEHREDEHGRQERLHRQPHQPEQKDARRKPADAERDAVNEVRRRDPSK
jgi:hypothetical protein